MERAFRRRVRWKRARSTDQLLSLAKEVQIGKAAAADLRSDYRQLIKEANYSTLTNVQWRYN